MGQYRILYLVPDLFGPPGGIARHARTVCQSLCEAGVDLSVLSLLDQPDARPSALPFTTSQRYLGCGGNRRLFVKQALDALKQRPALVLVEHPNFAHLGWIVARLSRAPLVVVAHGIDAWEPLSFARRWALGKADCIICVSSFTAHRAAEVNRFSLDRTRVLYNCLEPGFVPKSLQGRNNQTLSLLTVARISSKEKYKGHDFVIRAMPTLLSQFPELIYDIVGDGDGRPALEQLAEQLGVARAVRFHGKVSESDLLKRYEEASVFVMPSRGEGFGIAFLEAMAHGLPVIGGNVDASPEVIHDGEAGFAVNPTSIEELIKAITTLLADSVLRQSMGAEGLRLAQSKFSYETFQKTLMAYLEEVQSNRALQTNTVAFTRDP